MLIFLKMAEEYATPPTSACDHFPSNDMASLIRQAVSEFRMREQRGSTASFQEVLKHTAGIWQAGDGLEYQERIRKEWP